MSAVTDNSEDGCYKVICAEGIPIMRMIHKEYFEGTLEECFDKHPSCKGKEFTLAPKDSEGPRKAKSKDGSIEVEENDELFESAHCLVKTFAA